MSLGRNEKKKHSKIPLWFQLTPFFITKIKSKCRQSLNFSQSQWEIVAHLLEKSPPVLTYGVTHEGQCCCHTHKGHVLRRVKEAHQLLVGCYFSLYTSEIHEGPLKQGQFELLSVLCIPKLYLHCENPYVSSDLSDYQYKILLFTITLQR